MAAETYESIKADLDLIIASGIAGGILSGGHNSIFTRLLNSVGIREFDATRAYYAGQNAIIRDGRIEFCTTDTGPGVYIAGHWFQGSKSGRANSNISLLSGSNAVFFLKSIQTTDYALTCRVYDNDGNNVDFQITNKAQNKFDITVPEDCKLDYIAQIND